MTHTQFIHRENGLDILETFLYKTKLAEHCVHRLGNLRLLRI